MYKRPIRETEFMNLREKVDDTLEEVEERNQMGKVKKMGKVV